MKLKSTEWCLILGLIFSSLAIGASFASADGPVVSTRPIVFVHGFNEFNFGEDCAHIWGPMETALTAQGFTGPKVTVGYYGVDPHCDVMTTPKGTVMTSIPTLSQDLAWYIYDTFSSKNIDIDVVAHSMGGLVVRYALYRVAVGDVSFPPRLNINHVATMGVPYTGYSLVAETCHLIPVNMQCDEMFPLSSFIEGLKNPQALVPQGANGTLWSGIGSNAFFVDKSDGFVNSASAISMDIPASAKMILPWHMFVFHSNYSRNSTVIASVAKSLSMSAAANIETPATEPRVTSRRLASPELIASADAVVSGEELSQDFSLVPSDRQPAKIVANMIGKDMKGVLFTDVLRDGLFDRMGIQNGDVVRGCKIKNINEPFSDLATLETSHDPIMMKFCVERNGKKIKKKILVQ